MERQNKGVKKALIFDPYLDTLGGGERYSLTFALALSYLGYRVDLAWNNEADIQAAQDRFSLDLSQININREAYTLFARKTSLIDRIIFTSSYDLFFWVSDGSLPFLFGKKNLVHFQVPFTRIGGNQFTNALKLLFINRIVYNSEFTRSMIEKSLPRARGFVLYPPVAVDNFLPGKKEKLILSVGRFDSPSHSKRQDILIDAFRVFSSQTKGYRLVLAGGFRGDRQIIDSLKEQAKGLSVEVVPNLGFDKLKSLYARAQFFWHAAGYGADEEKEPEKVEHFGITTAEAMSAGCVPIVIAKGGQKEIVISGSGELVNSPEEMARSTAKIIREKSYARYSQKAVSRSSRFSQDIFIKRVSDLLQ